MQSLNICVGLGNWTKWTKVFIKKLATISSSNKSFVLFWYGRQIVPSRGSTTTDIKSEDVNIWRIDTLNGEQCFTLYIFYHMYSVFNSTFYFIIKCLRILYTIMLIFERLEHSPVLPESRAGVSSNHCTCTLFHLVPGNVC